jgi:lysophospholipase L1-like esterase
MRLAAAAVLSLLLLPASAAAVDHYVAFGDSITEGVGDDPARPEKGYPPRLEVLLTQAGVEAQVDNQGKGGEKTPEGLERIDSVLVPGGILLLMEGSNDISREISVEATRFNLREMARRAESSAMTVVHATVIPRTPQAKVDADNKTTARLDQNIRDLAFGRGRKLADNFEVFWEIPDRFNTHYLIEADDFVGHPNAQGYDVMARTFFETLRDIDHVPPVTGIIDPPDGDRGVPVFTPLSVDVLDFGTGVDRAATSLLVNGAPVAATLTGEGRLVHLDYAPTQAWSGVVHVTLRSRDTATPANSVDREIAAFYPAGITFLGGDVDRDGRVDGNDLVLFGRAFGAHLGGPRYVVTADTNTDGSIDGVDLAVLASNFGRSI